MKRSRLLTLALAGLAAAAVATLIVMRSADRAPPAVVGLAPGRAIEPMLTFSPAELITLAPLTLTRSIPITGSLNAVAQTVVKSRVSGDIVEIEVREGMPVKVGQLIARVDPLDFELRVRERETQLRSSEAQLDLARRNFSHNDALFARGYISRSAFDNVRSSLQVAEAARDTAIAQLDQARKALADTRILAPMQGLIAQRFVQPGEKVSPDGKIVSIVDLSRMEIEAAVPAAEVPGVRTGQKVSLRVEGVAHPVDGTVLRISPATQAGTRSVPIFVGIDNREAQLRAGLFAQGQLALERRDSVLAIPLVALRDQSGRRFVYVVDNDVIAEREVKTGLIDESALAPNGATGMVEVLEGLRAGERIVAANLGTLRPGTRAQIR